ncbi:MAG: PQQ-like beta-propeller repeat protein [Polyangiaceae bacterium]|nr:PQQ-like beta-propeller repeat protein [Polyangiaceae bacterium]
MARLIVAKCPSCGANVKIDPQRDIASCSFCGASSFIQREGNPAPQRPPNTRVIVVPRSTGVGPILVLAGFFVAAAVGAGAFFASRGASNPPSSPRSQGPVRPGSPAKPSPAEELGIFTARVPMLADATGDGAPDLIVSFDFREGGAIRYSFGAFNGRTGEPLWKTEDLGSTIFQTTAAVDKDRLFVADAKGNLFAYALRDGKRQWQTSLGDKALRYCRAPEPDSIRVITADKRVLVIDVKTGGQRPATDNNTKTTCSVLPGNERPTFSPEPTGYPDMRGPLGVEAWVCGSVRVMGDRNFIMQDSCGPRMKVNPNVVQGMYIEYIVREGEGWILVGSKNPGTRTPMVGFVTRGKLVWTTVVPDGNPLEARAGSPSRIAVAGGLVAVPYIVESRGARVAAFDVGSGRRVWDVGLAKGVDSIEEIVASGDTVFVGGDEHITALSVKDGSVRFGVGNIQ